MLAVSRRAWASRSPASARASCRVRSAPSVAAWVSFSASVRALATFCSASWLAVSTALKALTALRGRLDCTSTRTTWMPSPLPAAANAARLWLMPCTRSPRRRSRRSATALSLPSNSGRATRMVSRSRADLHGVARHQPVQRRQHVGALEDVGVRVVDLVEHPHVQLHHPGVAGQQVAGAGQRVAGQADVEIGATRLLGTQQALDAAFDHLFGGRQQHHLLQRLRPGQQQAGTGQALQRAQAQHYGAVLRADLADVGKRPGQRRQEGHAEQCEERQASGLQPGAAQPLVRFVAHGRRPLAGASAGSAGGPSTSTRNGAASVRKTSRVSPLTMVPRVSSERSRLYSCGEPA